MTSRVDTEINEGVLSLRFNQPEKKNALTPAMYKTASKAIAQAQADPAVRAILLTGAGGNFTSGNDVSAFPKPEPGVDPPPFHFIVAVIRSDLPVVAAVDGVAAGIGATLLLHCDAVLMSPNARLVFPFLRLALVPEAGSSLLLREMLGFTRASNLLLSGEPVSADNALELGIATDIQPNDTLHNVAMGKAKAFAQLPAGAVAKTRRLLRGDPERIVEQVRREQSLLFECFASDEHRQALAALKKPTG